LELFTKSINKFAAIPLGLVLMFLVCWIALQVESFPGDTPIKNFLMRKVQSNYATLIEERSLSSRGDEDTWHISTYDLSAMKDSPIYIMGGSVDSLHHRYTAAAILYQKRMAGKIMTLSDQTIIGFDPILKRNPLKNEWSLRKLQSLGVNEGDIEFLDLDTGFLGTLSEAKALKGVLKERGIHNLIILTSQNHTERTWNTFSKFLSDQNITFSLYAASDYNHFNKLINEYLKLLIYRILLID
jgi:uncharacterized SAM-binding protein YcdF (DUF218 family)